MAASIELVAIDRHKYPEFVVSMLSNIYTITNCGFRNAVSLYEYLNETLGWNMQEIPCFNTVENWIKKSGYNIYTHPLLKDKDENYACIIDESIMVGNERLVLNLGLPANKTTDHALNYNDIEVLGIHVDSTWNATQIEKALKEDEKKMKKRPSYIISDNDSKLRNAIANYGCTQIRDIGHTLSMFLRRIYGKETDFCNFTKQIARVKINGVMNDCSYLLPPRQRTIARFMNLAKTIGWSHKVISSFHNFTEKEKIMYGFVPDNKELVSELHAIFQCFNSILSIIKIQGLSYNSIGQALSLINMVENGKNKRMAKFTELTKTYLLEEVCKLPLSNVIFNASSDIIESIFGCYKFRKSENALHGVTPYVLVLPLLTKMKEPARGLQTNFKHNLEGVYMSDLKLWKQENLTNNQDVKRRKTLVA